MLSSLGFGSASREPPPEPPPPTKGGASTSASRTINIFLRPPLVRRVPLCLQVVSTKSTLNFWETVAIPALDSWGIDPAAVRPCYLGRPLPIDAGLTLADVHVGHLSTIDLLGRLPSQGFSQLHQLMEHLLEMLAPVAPANAAPPAAEEASSSREPIMHAIDSEIKRGSSRQYAEWQRCCCLSCTRRPSSTLWLCGALLHSTDAAVVNITFRVLQLLLHARTDCPAPLVFFDDESGALTLGAREADFPGLFETVQEALTPEGVAIASLLSQRLVRDRRAPPCARPPIARASAHVRTCAAAPLAAWGGRRRANGPSVCAGVRCEDAPAALAAPHQETDAPRARREIELAGAPSDTAAVAQPVETGWERRPLRGWVAAPSPRPPCARHRPSPARPSPPPLAPLAAPPSSPPLPPLRAPWRRAWGTSSA